MLVSAVLDPAALERLSLDDPTARQAAIALLDDFRHNGVLVVDAGGILRRELVVAVRSIQESSAKKVIILLEELLKAPRSRVVSRPIGSVATDTLRFCVLLGDQENVDAVITTNPQIARAIDQGIPSARLISLTSYLGSPLYQQRRKYAESTGLITDRSIAMDMLRRALKFARRLRLYDPQLGKATRKTKFGEGILSILELWKNCARFRPEHVDIYSCAEPGTPPYVLEALGTLLDKEICAPLRTQCALGVAVHLVPYRPDFHGRFIESDNVVIMVDPGFDAFGGIGTMRATSLIVKQNCEEMLRGFREGR